MVLLKLHIARYRDFYWPVWLEIAYSRPFWGVLGGYDRVPLGIGYRRKGSRVLGVPDGRKSFKIGLAVLTQYRRVTDTQPPASQPAIFP